MCISNAGTHGHIHQFGQSGQSRPRCWSITQCPIARTWESAPKQCTVMAIVEDKSPTFETILRELSGCICILSVFKNKNPFWWLLWHWSSLCQLNLESTRPKGLEGCKVPTDLVKISVKEAMHMCLNIHCNIWKYRQGTYQCQIQNRQNSIINAPVSCLFCIKSSMWYHLTSWKRCTPKNNRMRWIIYRGIPYDLFCLSCVKALHRNARCIAINLFLWITKFDFLFNFLLNYNLILLLWVFLHFIAIQNMFWCRYMKKTYFCHLSLNNYI